MSLDFLKKRINVLTTEHLKAVDDINRLTNELERARANANMVLGHLNEAKYQLAELSKCAPAESSPPVENPDGQGAQEVDSESH